MNERMFDSPVFVKQGSSIVQEIACLEDALEFLYDWPDEKRGAVYETALRACRRAFESDYPLHVARNAFHTFARYEEILEEVSAPLPWMVSSPSTRDGGVAA